MNYKAENMHYFDMYVPSFDEMMETCVWPSISQISKYMFTFFIWNITFRLTSQLCKYLI